MFKRRLTVFLSSTGRDLEAYRRAIIDHMRPLDGFICDAMEDFGARDAETVAFCRERVVAADVLVGLIGHWRGWEPPDDSLLRSITEMEYAWAGEAGCSRLMYVAPEASPCFEDVATTPEAAQRQNAFRNQVLADGIHDDRFYHGKIIGPDALAAAVIAALANVQHRKMQSFFQASEVLNALLVLALAGFMLLYAV